MNRRHFVTAAAASASLAAVPATAAGKNAILELRYYRLRSDIQGKRTTDFLGNTYLPAAQRAGLGPLGFFNAVIGEGSPFILALLSYPSLDAVGQAQDTLLSDKAFRKGWEEFNATMEMSYVRMDNTLLRAFDGMPSVVVPPAAKSPRIFELRTYESRNEKAGRTKVQMFNEAEMGIFQRLGMQPVFFGQALVGRNLPHLSYMVCYENLATRDRMWSEFSGDAEWKKLRARPEYADADIVSNISNSILRALPFSPIR